MLEVNYGCYCTTLSEIKITVVETLTQIKLKLEWIFTKLPVYEPGSQI